MGLKLASRATVYDRYAVSRKFTAQETAINVVQGNISLLVSESEIAELKNGNKTMFSRLSSVEVNVKSITLAVSASEYNDINGVLSAITQARAAITLTSKEIELKVSKNSIVSSINQSAEAVTINAGKMNLNGVVTANQNFKILADGSMVAKNGSFTGVINATSGIFRGSITGATITGSEITGSNFTTSKYTSLNGTQYEAKAVLSSGGISFYKDNASVGGFVAYGDLALSMNVLNRFDIGFSISSGSYGTRYSFDYEKANFLGDLYVKGRKVNTW